MFLVALFFVAYIVAYFWGIASLSKGRHKKFWWITGTTIIAHIGIVYAESKLNRHSSVDMAIVLFHQLILAVYVILMGLSATLVGISRRSAGILVWSVPIVILAILAIISVLGIGE
jgi:hypothetical protein